MRFGFSYIGLIWLILLFVPNMIWTKNKPQDYEKYVEGENKVLLVLERAGQFIVTPVAIIFSDFKRAAPISRSDNTGEWGPFLDFLYSQSNLPENRLDFMAF